MPTLEISRFPLALMLLLTACVGGGGRPSFAPSLPEGTADTAVPTHETASPHTAEQDTAVLLEQCTPDDIVSELVFRHGSAQDCTVCTTPLRAVLRWVSPCAHDVLLFGTENCWLDSWSMRRPDGTGGGVSGSCGFGDTATLMVVPAGEAIEHELELDLFLGGPGTYTVLIEPIGMPSVEGSFVLL